MGPSKERSGGKRRPGRGKGGVKKRKECKKEERGEDGETNVNERRRGSGRGGGGEKVRKTRERLGVNYWRFHCVATRVVRVPRTTFISASDDVKCFFLRNRKCSGR